MPHVEITIGGRTFEVACQEGEEEFLNAAARTLDAEASAIAGQVGRMTEARMLLMAGLMLADRTAALEDSLSAAEGLAGELKSRLDQLLEQPKTSPERVEVPVVPVEVTETLAELAARTEALADEIERKSGT
ncbi:cell division protein ZapA [Roseisalinus antarcticus]|uniref:Cell division protein ZapA n=1 Tax=Roseisalinus antarcticus TaxID=254357 RepID=A0A1Y5RJX3_9RHOB|nr:cell division protein ZapA [Roseisalinus antarcticus]SLN16472.1 Cell division protein ZapA [Roseisalinus antarcticus]